MDDNGKRSSYIAAQCPFDEATAMDTWRLIYQQAVPTVVVLNRIIEDGSLRCLQFWPDMGKVERGPFIVSRLCVCVCVCVLSLIHISEPTRRA